jgi:hypothetical protein
MGIACSRWAPIPANRVNGEVTSQINLLLKVPEEQMAGWPRLMRAATAIYESSRPYLLLPSDPGVARWARDSILTAQVCYGHLFLLITRQKLQTLIRDPSCVAQS